MRKTLLTLIILALAYCQLAQAQDLPVDSKTEKITFIEVVDATGLSSEELFTTLKNWGISKGFKVKSENASEGEIVFDANLPVEYTRVKGKIEQSAVACTFSLFAKEGKFRYVISNFVHIDPNPTLSGGKLELPSPACGPSMSMGNWNLIKTKTKTSIETLVTDIKKTVKQVQNDPARDKNW